MHVLTEYYLLWYVFLMSKMQIRAGTENEHEVLAT